MPSLIGFEFEQKLRLSETEIFGPKPLSFRCTSIKKVIIFREVPLYYRKLANHDSMRHIGLHLIQLNNYKS